MARSQRRPVILLLASHWLSMLGVTLAALAGCSWVIALPLQAGVSNPYMGLLIFIALPVLFFTGLILIPAGIALGRRKVAATFTSLPDRAHAWKRLGTFFVAGTVINVIVGSQLTYRAVAYMDTQRFCGSSCHVMKPEYTVYQNEVHAHVACVDCHVAPGVEGWLKGKMEGTRQLFEVAFNTFPRPIPSAIETNRLVPATETCEGCHWPGGSGESRLRVFPDFASDEANTRTETVLMMLIGGGKSGGIHGSHFGPGVEVRYAAADPKRQTIPWVQYRNRNTGKELIFQSPDVKPEDLARMPRYTMLCADCHNRTAHDFQLPEQALDRAMADGSISPSLPYAKQQGVAILKAGYRSQDEAARKIPAAVEAYYRQNYPQILTARAADIQQAGRTLTAIYRRNVFPDLKVDWGTYPDNRGHMNFPGCFRCHDGQHSSSNGAAISQDCGSCHQMVVVDEPSPRILTTLGIASAD